VLVEDCISACVLFSTGLTGIAILGTSLKNSYIPAFKKYKKVYVCLDKDATSKAFDIADQLSYYVNTEVKILDDDIKYLGNSTIQEMFGGD
jgi:DNA primase